VRYLLYLVLAFLLVSCDKQESFTIKGKFLNGTTNEPYQNVKINFTKIVGPPGFVKYTDLGSTSTDENGDFEFTYSVLVHDNGNLQLVFERDGIEMLIKSDIDLSKNNTKNFYLSDSNTCMLSFKTNRLLNTNEILKVYSYNNAFDTLLFTKNELDNTDFKFRFKTKKMFRDLIVERVSPDSTVSIFNPSFNMECDPVINDITVLY